MLCLRPVLINKMQKGIIKLIITYLLKHGLYIKSGHIDIGVSPCFGTVGLWKGYMYKNKPQIILLMILFWCNSSVSVVPAFFLQNKLYCTISWPRLNKYWNMFAYRNLLLPTSWQISHYPSPVWGFVFGNLFSLITHIMLPLCFPDAPLVWGANGQPYPLWACLFSAPFYRWR